MKKIFVILALILCNACYCVAQTWTWTTATLTTNVKTPNGYTVPDTYIVKETPLTAGDIAAAKKLVAYYGGEYLEDPTWTYNCHAYAWHIIEGGTPAPVWIGWINPVPPDIYWNHTFGGYSIVDESVATKVVYAGNHSAVRESQNLYVSKWGAGPKVRHAPKDVPPEYKPTLPKTFYARSLSFDLNVPSTVQIYQDYDNFYLTNFNGIISSVSQDYQFEWYVRVANTGIGEWLTFGYQSQYPPTNNAHAWFDNNDLYAYTFGWGYLDILNSVINMI